MGNSSIKLLNPSAPLDLMTSYITDAVPLWGGHLDWVREVHSDGDAMAGQLKTAGKDVISASARQRREEAEAVEATAAQTEGMKTAAALAAGVRRKGAFIARELERSGSPADKDLARKLRICTGVGVRFNLDRQSAVRRLLSLQLQGLKDVKVALERWGVYKKLQQDLEQGLADLERLIRNQSKEQLEADLALDDLDSMVDGAVTLLNRGIGLVNAFSESAPRALVSGLVSLQGDHPGVFYRQAAGEAGEEDVEETDEAEVAPVGGAGTAGEAKAPSVE